MVFSLLECSWSPYCKSIGHRCLGRFLDFLFCSVGHLSAVIPKSHSFDYCSFVGSFEIYNYLTSSFFSLLLFQHGCNYSGPLISLGLWGLAFLFLQKAAGFIIGIILGSCCLNNRSSSLGTQEDKMFHLFRSLYLSAVVCSFSRGVSCSTNLPPFWLNLLLGILFFWCSDKWNCFLNLLLDCSLLMLRNTAGLCVLGLYVASFLNLFLCSSSLCGIDGIFFLYNHVICK